MSLGTPENPARRHLPKRHTGEHRHQHGEVQAAFSDAAAPGAVVPVRERHVQLQLAAQGGVVRQKRQERQQQLLLLLLFRSIVVNYSFVCWVVQFLTLNERQDVCFECRTPNNRCDYK